jgi:diaminohydroxyphosphoribosylaminopyrimidine deaminase/5-amino-6-(5-phosphoribosylamino)uracil reductase
VGDHEEMDPTAALDRALELARLSPDTRPNPRVGCVLLDSHGDLISEGSHQGAGMPHAEVEALTRARLAGFDVRGATAVVTLEPCNHQGRTGPCAEALIAAGVSRVVMGQADPNPEAAGGSDRLREAGIAVANAKSPEALRLNRQWTFAMRHGRPFVIWKAAATLDGRIAATDGSSRWITGPEARQETHGLRAEVDAVIVGTGTVTNDDPELNARIPGVRQPLRVVMGMSQVPETARIRSAEPAQAFRHLGTREPARALSDLLDEGVHYVLLEGGPRLAAGFVAAGLVDRIRWYIAPKLLGAGPAALADIGVASIDQTRDWVVRDVKQVGSDVRVDLEPRVPNSGGIAGQ